MVLLLLFLHISLPPGSPVEWLTPMTVDVGDTVLDVPVTYTFRFRNLAAESVTVENVRVGCGCTATEWQDVPVAPGEEGTITVTYDADLPGSFRKYVKVFFVGHRGGHKLWLEGFVENGP